MALALSLPKALTLPKQLKPDQWLNELGRLSVIVIECGSFRNLIEDPSKKVSLSHLALLVLDECHHCKV